MALESIESKILSKIKKCGRGNLLFASDFVRYGEQKTINKALERLAKEEIIVRISRGVYYYPKIDKVLGLGVLYPSLEEIAEGIAKRDKARIVPTGIYALNRLGFSTQIPMNIGILLPSNELALKVSEELRKKDVGCELKYSTDAAKDARYVDSLNFATFVPKIMTYYSAKGLQFDIVILPMYNGASDNESRKALYVAMTRTMHKLFVLYSTTNLAYPLSDVPTRLYLKNEV